MISFNEGDPKRISHFIKVHSFARLIGIGEKLDDTTLFILEAAAYTHDIGIRPAEEKYGRCDGKLQEQEGPIYAQQMLSELGFENYMIEADFLVNLYEDCEGKNARRKAYENIFRTESGKRMFREMFGFSEET
jgi:HD superfamily phosphodiesterase